MDLKCADVENHQHVLAYSPKNNIQLGDTPQLEPSSFDVPQSERWQPPHRVINEHMRSEHVDHFEDNSSPRKDTAENGNSAFVPCTITSTADDMLSPKVQSLMVVQQAHHIDHLERENRRLRTIIDDLSQRVSGTVTTRDDSNDRNDGNNVGSADSTGDTVNS